MLIGRAAVLQEDIKNKQRTLAHMLAGTATEALPPWKRPKQDATTTAGCNRVANASVISPGRVAPPVKWGWSCVKGNCQPGKSNPCGMLHPASHVQCYRCGSKSPEAKPRAPPKAQVAPVAAVAIRNIAEPVVSRTTNDMDVDAQTKMHPTELAVNSALADTCILHTVQGPDVLALFALLEIEPSPTDASAEAELQQKITEAKVAVSEAKDDVVHAQTLSLRVQKITAESALSAERDLQTLMEKQLPIDNCDPYATFESLDKARADASQNLAKWETRVAHKVQNVKENLAISINGAQQAV